MFSRLSDLFTVVGPGLVTSFADNDAGGVATYSAAGAALGYQLLWVLLLSTFALIVVQEITVRIAVTTGKGLSDLIRESFGLRMTLLAMGVLFIANLGTTISNFAGIAASMELFSIPKIVSVPTCAFAIWLMVTRGSYRIVEKVLLSIALILVAYVGAGILSEPNWVEAWSGLFIPTISFTREHLFFAIAIVGTTITPWMQFYLHSSIVEKGVHRRFLGTLRWELVIGAFLTNIIAFFIIVACAATLHTQGVVITTAQEAAKALEPLAGEFAESLFGIGLLGASILGVFAVPLSTAYALSEAFGMENGVNKKVREAPFFYGLYFFILFVSVIFVLIPYIPLIPIMIFIEWMQGVLLPFVLFFMLRLANDQRLMGSARNSFWANVVGGGTGVALAVLSLLLVVGVAFGIFSF